MSIQRSTIANKICATILMRLIWFAQLEGMRDTSKILDFYEVQQLLARIGASSPLEDAGYALHIREISELNW